MQPVHELIEHAISGGDDAWHALWQISEPVVWAVTGKFQITGPLSELVDERRNIVLSVMDRLRADGFRRLRCYLDSTKLRPGSSYRSWLATVTARAAIDYVRAHPEYTDERGKTGGVRWVRLVALRDEHAPVVKLDPEKAAIAASVLERAKDTLRADQLAALLLWLQGESKDTIASELALADPADADRLVRSALKRLRDRFRSEDPVQKERMT